MTLSVLTQNAAISEIETEVTFRLESVSSLGAMHPDWQHLRCLLYAGDYYLGLCRLSLCVKTLALIMNAVHSILLV